MIGQDGFVAGAEGSGPQAGGIGFVMEDAPAIQRLWHCQHCGAEIRTRVQATFNGAPLCVPRTPEDPSCYRMVSTLNHQMPCEEDPCPGEVPLAHTHEEGEQH